MIRGKNHVFDGGGSNNISTLENTNEVASANMSKRKIPCKYILSGKTCYAKRGKCRFSHDIKDYPVLSTGDNR